MPRYFVRVKVNGKLLPDDDPPEEFSDLEAVRAVVLESAREVLSQEVLKGTAASLDIQIEVEDERGQRVLVVPVGRVVDTVSQV
jgi:hypothetical protein